VIVLKKTATILLCIGYLLVSVAEAETVLYCTSELSTGIHLHDGNYRVGKILADRLTVKFNTNFSVVHGFGNKKSCRILRPLDPDILHCTSNGDQGTERSVVFFNKRTMKYTFAALSGWTYVQSPQTVPAHTNSVSAGSCESF